MKTSKKILSVLLLSVVLLTAVVVPCFAWEWNGNYPQYLASSVLPTTETYIASTPTAGAVSWSGNAYTNNSCFNELYIPRDTPVDILGSGTVVTQTDVDSSNNTKIYTGDKMLYVDRPRLAEVYNTLHNNGEHTYNATSTSYDGYYGRQFVRSLGLAQAQFTRIFSTTDDTKYLADYYGICGTSPDVLPWVCTYSVYASAVDFSLSLNYNYSYRAPSGEWVHKTFDGNIAPEISYDVGGYYQHNFNIGSAIKSELESNSDYESSASVYILIDSLGIGCSQPLRAFRRSYLCSISGSPEPIYNSSRSQNGGNIYSAIIHSPIYNRFANPEDLGLEGIGEFLGSSVSGLFSFSLYPGITLGGIFVAVLCICLVIVFLKIFAGG